jgi:hypothetical protein
MFVKPLHTALSLSFMSLFGHSTTRQQSTQSHPYKQSEWSFPFGISCKQGKPCMQSVNHYTLYNPHARSLPQASWQPTNKHTPQHTQRQIACRAHITHVGPAPEHSSAPPPPFPCPYLDTLQQHNKVHNDIRTNRVSAHSSLVCVANRATRFHKVHTHTVNTHTKVWEKAIWVTNPTPPPHEHRSSVYAYKYLFYFIFPWGHWGWCREGLHKLHKQT